MNTLQRCSMMSRDSIDECAVSESPADRHQPTPIQVSKNGSVRSRGFVDIVINCDLKTFQEKFLKNNFDKAIKIFGTKFSRMLNNVATGYPKLPFQKCLLKLKCTIMSDVSLSLF